MAGNQQDLKTELAKRQPSGDKQIEKATPFNSLAGMLEKYHSEIAAALPAHINVEHMIRMALMDVRLTPKLLECTQASFLGHVFTCARIGLEPGPLGHIYAVPFWNGKEKRYEVQTIVGYKGYVRLAYNSKLVENIMPVKIHTNDRLEIVYGSEPHFIHEVLDWAHRGDVIGYYIIVKFIGGGYATSRPWSVEEVQQHRDKYVQKDKYGNYSKAWREQFDEMAFKTVWRDLADWLPLSSEVAQALVADGTVKRDIGKEALDLPGEIIEIIAEDAKEPDTAEEPNPYDAEPETIPVTIGNEQAELPVSTQ